jgi:ArsR family transcriptional regulator
MNRNKKTHFPEDTQRIARVFKALSHPARIEILRVLAERQQCVCGEIVEILPLAQSTVSQHLKELKEAELIKGEIEGAKSCYCINWEEYDEFFQSFSNLYENMNQLKSNTKLECC